MAAAAASSAPSSWRAPSTRRSSGMPLVLPARRRRPSHPGRPGCAALRPANAMFHAFARRRAGCRWWPRCWGPASPGRPTMPRWPTLSSWCAASPRWAWRGRRSSRRRPARRSTRRRWAAPRMQVDATGIARSRRRQRGGVLRRDSPLPLLSAVQCRQRAAACAHRRPGRPARRGAARARAGQPAQGLRRAQGRRRCSPTPAACFEIKPTFARNIVDGVRRGWPAGRSASSPTSRCGRPA